MKYGKFAMMEKSDVKLLTQMLQKYYLMTENEMDMVSIRVQPMLLKNGACFLAAGKVAKQLGLVTEGVISVCYNDGAGSVVTKAFITKNHFALNIYSFYHHTPSAVDFKALTDCKMLVLSENALSELAVAIPAWSGIMARIATTEFSSKLSISNEILRLDARAKYLKFLDTFPGLANQIPLSALASYLGITPSSLSRIRKSF